MHSLLIGYDKLKPFGFPVHAAIDGYRRRVLWLEVVRSNNSPDVPTRLFLDAVKEVGGCPLLVRTDCGTENRKMAGIQCYFRSERVDELAGENAHQFGSSTRNQRIENWWSYFRKARSHWWINFFKDMLSAGLFELANDLQKECLWFCFYSVLNKDFQKTKDAWNSHHIRPSRHDCVSGSPDILFFFLERSGAADNLQIVPEAKIIEMDIEHELNEEENKYQEYFHYVMEHDELWYPSNPEEAFNLYRRLMNIAVS